MNSKVLLVLAVCAGGACPAVLAGDAVSAVNGKLEAVSGNLNGGSANAALGSLTAPLGKHVGAQLDALSGKANGGNISGYGGHLFWRDSAKGLVGLTGSQVKNNGTKINRAGVEGEYYWQKVTLSGELGKQRGDIPNANYGRLDVKWYPHDNLALDAGASKADTLNRQHLGIEYQTKVNGLALFADAATGNNHYDHLLAGITYYIGNNKSLKQRHREDDPINPLLASVKDYPAAAPAATTPSTPPLTCGPNEIVHPGKDGGPAWCEGTL